MVDSWMLSSVSDKCITRFQRARVCAMSELNGNSVGGYNRDVAWANSTLQIFDGVLPRS